MTRRFIGRFGFACLTATLILAPAVLFWLCPSGMPPHPAWPGGRKAVGLELIEARFSQGFAGVADAASAEAVPPDWEAFRRVLERSAAEDLWFSVRVAWLTDEGGREEMTYVRQPYHDPGHFREFLDLVRGDMPQSDADATDDQGRDLTALATGPIPRSLLRGLAGRRAWVAPDLPSSPEAPTPDRGRLVPPREE